MDPLVADLGALGGLLTTEQQGDVLVSVGIENYDTLVESRRRGSGGHRLLAAVQREPDRTMDKRPQTSDWTQRPLSASQERYAVGRRGDRRLVRGVHSVMARAKEDEVYGTLGVIRTHGLIHVEHRR